MYNLKLVKCKAKARQIHTKLMELFDKSASKNPQNILKIPENSVKTSKIVNMKSQHIKKTVRISQNLK